MKKVIGGLSLLALMALALPAGAANIESINDSSVAKIKYRLMLNISSSNNNLAAIDNQVTATSNSGGNTIESAGFQSGTVLTTGEAGAVTEIDNTANSIELDSSTEVEFGSENDQILSVNGSSTAKVKNTQDIVEGFANLNDVSVLNVGTAVANSGENQTVSEEGLQNSEIRAGNAITASVVANRFNRISQVLTRIVR
ncbi:MAG: hypothetical protein HY336_01980 [Candidatus Doudnabacteria bacterium]|nr:hypothetical protein [Candidatus Doudnabacteria bacterium]